MTALFVGSLGCFISLLSVYKRLWRAKTEEASVWFSHDHKYPSCWERGGFRLVSEEQGQAKLDCPSVKKPPVAAEGTFPVPTGTLCRRHMIAPPPTFCILFSFFLHSHTGLFQGVLVHSWLHWACSWVQPVTIMNAFCYRKSHRCWKYHLCFLAILFNSCSFYFTSAWISDFQAQKMICLMPSHAALQSNRF